MLLWFLLAVPIVLGAVLFAVAAGRARRRGYGTDGYTAGDASASDGGIAGSSWAISDDGGAAFSGGGGDFGGGGATDSWESGGGDSGGGDSGGGDGGGGD